MTVSASLSAPRHDAACPAYTELFERQARLHRLRHLGSLAQWDQAAFLPAKGAESRAEALAELGTLLHGLSTDTALAGLFDAAGRETLDADARANLREMQLDWQLATAVPADLVRRKTLATSRCERAWREQRQRNDWAGHLPLLREVVDIVREEAACLSGVLGLSRYDSLMALYEPGMRTARVQQLFDGVQTWLPDLVRQRLERQARQPVVPAAGPFAVEAQQRLSAAAMRLFGFDFDAGRLDTSAHPFTGGVPEDVRMTTRYRTDDLFDSLLATIHETGHGRYEQRLPRAWLGQPLARARSMALHESQSLSFEMQIARQPAFAAVLAPMLDEAFGAQPAFAVDNLRALLLQVQPGYIRVDADELTYPAHVMLRFDIERELIEGGLPVEDIPARWDEAMQRLLGIDTRGNYRDGPMQDSHWAGGLFGYFPCYLLGAMYAAQWFAALQRDLGPVGDLLATGRLSAILDWLDRHIWSQGCRWTTEELCQLASGEALNVDHYRSHLTERYLGRV